MKLHYENTFGVVLTKAWTWKPSLSVDLEPRAVWTASS